MTALKRAAIYARYSTDLQNENSIEGQQHECREAAARLGFTVVAEYCDRAKSSASMIGRTGLADLMENAKLRKFEAVFCEAPDRLSRNTADLSYIFERMKFWQIQIIGVHTGVMNGLASALHGIMGAYQLEAGSEKTRRGLKQKFREGKSAGGKAYGYRPKPGEKGTLEIVAEEAAIVVRIFTEYLSSKTPRQIAHGLNRDGVPAPRGRSWNASTINGNGQRGHGILRNPLYAGVMMFGRVAMVKDPDTGRRVSRVNPEADWQRHDHPELRIIDQASFDAVALRKAQRATDHASGNYTPRQTHLLSGLLRCGTCGSGMTSHGSMAGRARLRCSRARESGSCENRRPYYRDEIVEAVITNLRDWLAKEAAVKTFVDAYTAEWKAINRAALRERDSTARRALAVEGELDRLALATAKGTLPEATIEKLAKPLRIQREELQAGLARAEQAVPKIVLMPNAVEAYHQSMSQLAENLGALREDNPAAFEAVQRLIGRVIVHPGPPVTVEVVGRVMALTGLRKHDPEDTLKSVVAREGLEPPTPGL